MRFLLSVGVAMLLCGTSLAENKEQRSQKLRTRSEEVTLRPKASEPFEIRGTIKIHEAGGLKEGTYALFSNGPQQWRIEITFSDWSETEIRSHGELRWSRTTKYEPLLIGDIRQLVAMAMGGDHRFGNGNSTPPKTYPVKFLTHDNGLDCITQTLFLSSNASARYPDTTNQVCYSQDSGLLASFNLPNMRFAFDGVMTVSGSSKILPKHLVYSLAQQTSAELTLDRATQGSLPDELFSKELQGSETLSACDGEFKPVQPSRPPSGIYPPEARDKRLAGNLTIVGIVDTDGSFKDPFFLGAPGPPFEKGESLKAASAWKFKPATCDGKPIATEFKMMMLFR